jgi:hypothetical protein
VVAHGFALDEFIGVVVLEGERILRGWTFVSDFRNIRKKCHARWLAVDVLAGKRINCQYQLE